MEISPSLRLLQVVLLTEDVDRNMSIPPGSERQIVSSSLRRTWIEIVSSSTLLRELPSSSLRRTWIEIFPPAFSEEGQKRRPPRGGRG